MINEITVGTVFESTSHDTRYEVAKIIERREIVERVTGDNAMFILTVSVRMNDDTWKITNNSARFTWSHVQQNMNAGIWFLADVPENWSHSLDSIFDL